MKYLLLSFTFIIISISLLAQDIYTLSGTLKEGQGNTALAGAVIRIKNTNAVAVTKEDGSFQLKTSASLPLTVQVSSLGYASQEFVITNKNAPVILSLNVQNAYASLVVVTASRVPENILKSPVSIEKLSLSAIKEAAAPSFYDALENLKGVQLTTSSITFKVPNTRGFNIPNNFRFVQLVDGVDIQAATLGVSLGNSIGPTELDVENVEITPGAASALYGMNAINGMANISTKNPFKYPGLSVYQKTGVNHVDGIDRNASVLSETAIRYAHVFNQKWAFKINAGYTRATDWVSNTQTDQNPNNLSTANPLYPQLNGTNNAAYDGWNKYGDENNNAVTVTGINYNGPNKSFIVRRTGYWEKDLSNPTVENIKFDLALHHKFSTKTELSYSYRFGQMDGIFQRGNKIQLDNATVQNHKLEFKSGSFTARTYLSFENTGNSYNIKPLADNLDLTHLSNNAWRDRFRNAFQTSINNGDDLAVAANLARKAADAGRVEPGTTAFEQLKNTIIGINNWDHANSGIAGAPATGGAWLNQRSRMYHTDLLWDLTDKVKVFHLLVGADYRLYEVIPDGNNFVDFSRAAADRNKSLADGSFGKPVQYTKYGAFVQATKTFFDNRLKLVSSLRVDNNPEFSPKFNPRIALVYSAAQKHHIRASFQNGFRFPALFEAISFVNNGNVRRVGGLSYINEGLGYLDNSYTLSSVNEFNAAVNRDVATGLTANNAALKNRAILQVTSLQPTRPERINSFEVGYKSVLLDNKLVIDLDLYTNIYDGFLGQVEVAVPENNTVQVGSDAAVIAMLASNRARQTRYRVYTNAKNQYHNYGGALGLIYSLPKGFVISGNLNYNNISENRQRDVFVTGFNTPKWLTNVSLRNREFIRHTGFNIVWKWQDAFNWESPLANGRIAAFNTIDIQFTREIPELKTTIKLGGSNILNHRYIQYAAGPTIGALYYLAITFDTGFKPKS
ncbi:carboxypeptidase-like protein [Sediminibacterium goheungense]|uniref:Carboxypeptidase-like protein n=1 Tax=Sediminibacterium goheungense TaxID=1086393 RepID=A0A4R6J1S8_9BACT|nr:carboxypeptidase-like protein [Sediminibacterium goheungense]